MCVCVWGCVKVCVLIKTEREGEGVGKKKSLGERILRARQQGFTDEEKSVSHLSLRRSPLQLALLPYCLLLIAIVQYRKFPLSAHSL